MKKTARTRKAPTTLDRCLVRSDRTLVEAMRVIDSAAVGIALVIDAAGHMIGTLTDGDIRRALLGGAVLASPIAAHMKRRFVSVPPEASRAEVLDLMRARGIDQIPVVDRKGVPVGLHLLTEMLGRVERPNWAVIMAGGLGTRLRPITEQVPKPMLTVAGKPILERLVLHLVGFGIQTIHLSVNHLGHIIERHFGDGERFGCAIHYLREREPLGTGGSLSLLRRKSPHPLLVMNGDLVTQADIGALLRFHESGGHVATMAVRRYGHQVPFGCVEAQEGRIVRFEEKPVMERMINAGIYVLNPALLRRVPRRFFPITDLFGDAVARGESVGAFEVEEEWIDVGQREQLRAGRV